MDLGDLTHVFLVGPTATGKTALSVAYATDRGDVELVSADAFAVYRELDIGTAKPTPEERARVPWHLVDVCDPDEEFTVARFQRLVTKVLAEIETRQHRALVVGGTGLYHRAIVDRLQLPGRYPAVRAALEHEASEPGGLARLYERLESLDPLAATRTTATNERRIVRALEVTVGSGRPFSSFGPGLRHYGESPFVTVGLSLERGELDRRIEARLDGQLAAGFVDEAKRLSERPGGLSRTARQALGYAELFAYLEGKSSLADARERIVRRTRTFARRQLAWFARDPRVVWIEADGPGLLERFSAVAEGAPPVA